MLPCLFKKNWSLALHYHSGMDRLEDVLEKERPTCPVALFHANLESEAEIEDLCKAVEAHYGRIDVLINLAGLSHGKISWKTDLADWNRVMAVNLTAPFLLARWVLPAMRERGWGRIINISSVVAQTGVAGTAAYAASKAGLMGLTHTLAKEVAANGITVNTIALGYMEAGMIHELTPEMQQEILKRVPKQRLGDAQSLAELIAFLLSPAADFVTSQTLNLNGGLYA